jgi:hypothetical protein
VSARACAYCEVGGVALTKEEIFPKWLYRQHPAYTANLGRALPNIVLQNARAIKDVCETCNSERLSVLDHYASGLCKGYLKIVQPGKAGRLEYDHDLLARWIWKVGYNAARANDEPTAPYLPLRPYILGDERRPPSPQTLFATVIGADPCTPEEARALRSRYLYPKCIRVGTFPCEQLRPAITFIAFLGINSYMFILVLWNAALNRARRRAMANEAAGRDGTTLLPMGKHRVALPEGRMGSREYLSRNAWSPDPTVP